MDAGVEQPRHSECRGWSQVQFLPLAPPSPSRHHDLIPHADDAAMNDLGEHALFVVLHQPAQALAEAFHFLAGQTRFVEQQCGFADADFAPEEFNELHAQRLDVGTHRPGRNHLQPERRRVLGDLLAFHECDLAFARLTGAAAVATEVTSVPANALLRDDFDLFHRAQRFA